MMITLLNKNISVLLTKNLNFNPLVLRHASYSINTNIIKSKNFESFSHLKPRETSNLTIFLVNKKDFSIFKQKFQSRQEKSSESGKILTSLSLDNRKSNDDQVSTNVRPAEKAKQAVKDTSYGLIIICGGMILFAMFYYLFSELFTRESPSGIYNESSKICLDDFEVRDALGTPIKVSAESGGRRVFQIKHKFFIEDGQLYLILNYYLEGPKNKGVVVCKVKKNESTKKFEYENIVIKLDHPHRGQDKIYLKLKEKI